ncbi:MAG: GntR family transcriptional regulator [Jatrophihabitans sp.]
MAAAPIDELGRPTLQHRSLPESVHEILRWRILNNELPAGTPLVELVLAGEFGVSRTTIRAALRELQAERLVDVQPRRQTIVTRMSATEIAEACYTRYVLESAGLRDIWQDGRPGMVRDMKAAIGRMQEAADKGDLAGIVEADTELHRVIVSASGHPMLVEMWSTLDGQMGALMRSSLEQQGIDLAEVVKRHSKLLTAFRKQDPEPAVAALRAHYLDPTPHS